eukprot:TRINITY_DN62980_c0_g2_i1.p1 TRINITY_DN62980_c0_g2~~TRINITY_DN62980_c0_g2_i1.p1  ORF type:complete len:978 (-),score=124.16 TRINITY_DN62980_c0_g2_i1:124-2967(-)
MPNPHYMPELQIKVTIINFTVTPKGLEDQLLVDVVRYEKEELERQKDKLVLQISEGKSTLKSTEDKILSLLGSASGNILDNEVLIATLGQSKKTSEEVKKDVAVAEKTSEEILVAREKYRSVATRGSIIYTVIADFSMVDHMYQNSLQFFKKLFNQTLEKTERHDDLDKRLEILIPAVTDNTYVTVCRAIFEKDKTLFAFLMTAGILRNQGVIAEDEWIYVLRGSGTNQHDGAAPPPWMDSKVWNEVLGLTQLQGFEKLAESILRHNHRWKEIYECDDPHDREIPEYGTPQNEESKIWQNFLVLKVLREEKVLFGVKMVIGHYLGEKFTESPQFDLEGAYEDSSPTTPIIFVLSSGSDPTTLFLNFAQDKAFGDRKKMLSLGQDQGPKAEDMINTGIKAGEWVYLQNCHLAVSWMPGLEKIMEDLQLKDQIHPEFRLWLTSMPSAAFPVPVLQSGIKLTKEPPKGLKANLRDTFSGAITEKMWEQCRRPNEWKKLLFCLTFFHGLVQERRKFGPLGWNIPYEWNQSDLMAASKYLKMYLEDFDKIPWPAMQYIVGVINYGGRVTDFLDQRCLSTILEKFFDEAVLAADHAFTSDGVYHVPQPGTLSQLHEYLAGLPAYEKPEVFGLSSNADITFQKNESAQFMDTVISIQPRGSSAGGRSPDEEVQDMAHGLLGQVPPLISNENAHPSIFKVTKQGIMKSLSTVLVQEVERFNKLLRVVRKSLDDLIKAINGEVVMSSELDLMYQSFLFQKVPKIWANAAYPSLKPLGSWFEDLLKRVTFLRDWMENGQPKSFWISGFFFPQGFLTGVLQTHARNESIPIDELKFRTLIKAAQPQDLTSPPTIGVYIHGLFLEGASWDTLGTSVVESKKGELYCPMPVVHLECIHMSEPTSLTTSYRCPLYKTSTRAGALSTTGLSTNFVLNLELPTKKEPTHWILRGVALLCMLND